MVLVSSIEWRKDLPCIQAHCKDVYKYIRLSFGTVLIISLILNVIVLSENRAFGNEQRSAFSDVADTKSTSSTVNDFSAEAREIAELAEITPVLEQLESLQKSATANESSSNRIERAQEIIYLRGQLNALIQAGNLQINATRGRLESAIAQARELRAYIAERRNRITRRTNTINLISGGITKIVGYSVALGNLTAIPTNTLEVFDGGVQSALSALALREQQQENKLEHGMPPILESFLNNTRGPHLLAPGVWMYLNHPPLDNKTTKSRRQLLIESWEKSGILRDANTPNTHSKTKPSMSIDLLDERIAMLSDLESAVSEMHGGLMELSNVVAISYKKNKNELHYAVP